MTLIRRRHPILFSKAKKSRGQTALETFFVFTGVIFMSFAMFNLSVAMYTKFVATYAAFMAGRSYQVYGDQTGRSLFKETGDKSLLADQQTLTIIRTAEDIFTCALPWAQVPQSDSLSASNVNGPNKKLPFASCQEGKRKYQTTNINKSITMFRFDNKLSATSTNQSGQQLLEGVSEGFHETDRQPLRFAILKLQYKNPLLFNVFGVFNGPATISNKGQITVVDSNDASRLQIWHSVFVPVLLNPGLESGVKVVQGNQGNSDIDKSITGKTVTKRINPNAPINTNPTIPNQNRLQNP